MALESVLVTLLGFPGGQLARIAQPPEIRGVASRRAPRRRETEREAAPVGARVADVLARIAEPPHTRVHDLLPRSWRTARNRTLAA